MRAYKQHRSRNAGIGKNLVGFLVGDIQYAVDILRVREIIRPLPLVELPHAPAGIAGVADHRGEVVPVIEMRQRFALPAQTDERRAKWILITVGKRTIGLWVDSITGVLGATQADHRPLPELGEGHAARGITSVCAHSSGLVFVLDVDRIASVASAVSVPSLGTGSS